VFKAQRQHVTDGAVSIPQVALDIPHNQTLYELHQKVNAKEVIVGW